VRNHAFFNALSPAYVIFFGFFRLLFWVGSLSRSYTAYVTLWWLFGMQFDDCLGCLEYTYWPV